MGIRERKMGEFVLGDLCFFCFFFFQAEGGIRDAQESRGLGGVYERQMLNRYCLLCIELCGWRLAAEYRRGRSCVG